MRSVRSIFVVLILLSTNHLLSQTEIVTRDLETWSSVSLDKKYSDQFRLNLEQSLRMYDNSTQVAQFFTNLDLKYSISDVVSLTGGVRYIRDRDKDDGMYENRLRWNADLNIKHEIDRFTLKYRMRLQTRNELGYSRSEGDFGINAFRLRVGAGYNIKGWKLDPEMSAEIFRESGRYILSSFNKYRFSLQTKYKINKWLDVKAFYRFERELGVSYPLSSNIVGFNLMFNL